MYIIYCLINKEELIYIGQTNDIDRRLLEHNNPRKGKTRKYTKNKGPWKLFYQEEASTKHDALMRERELKSHKGRNWLRSLGAVAQW